MSLDSDVPIIRGDGTVELAFTVDTGVNFIGAAVTWGLRKNSPTGPVVLTKSATITDAAEKKFSVFLTKQDTEDLNGTFYHDAVIVDAGGNEITVRNQDGAPGVIEFARRVTVLS